MNPSIKTLKTIARKLKRVKAIFNDCECVDQYELERLLNEEFVFMKVCFEFWTDTKFSVEGAYDSLREFPDDPKYLIHIKYDPNEIFSGNFLFVELFNTIVHEMRHGYQHRARNYKKLPVMYRSLEAKDYLSVPDEIDAYAYEATLAILCYEDYWLVDSYRDTFYESNPKVYNRFLKKIYKFQKELEQGVVNGS